MKARIDPGITVDELRRIMLTTDTTFIELRDRLRISYGRLWKMWLGCSNEGERLRARLSKQRGQLPPEENIPKAFEPIRLPPRTVEVQKPVNKYQPRESVRRFLEILDLQYAK